MRNVVANRVAFLFFFFFFFFFCVIAFSAILLPKARMCAFGAIILALSTKIAPNAITPKVRNAAPLVIMHFTCTKSKTVCTNSKNSVYACITEVC